MSESKWSRASVYNEMHKRMVQLETYVRDNEAELSQLSPRERTFLKWKLEELSELILGGEDTEEESDEDAPYDKDTR